MDQEFWHKKWATNEIAFHRQEIHPLLQKHWPDPVNRQSGSVLVPLCGKSRDMTWLAERGHPVIGCEISEIAVKAFFDEQQIIPQQHEKYGVSIYEAGYVRLVCGDFFMMPDELLSEVRLVYDRAALIALPEDMRSKYVTRLREVLAGDVRILLITMEYEPGQISGPPFSVVRDNIHELFSGWCRIEEVDKAEAEVKGRPCHESVYWLHVNP